MEALTRTDWHRLNVSQARRCALVLAVLTLVFAARVLAQFLQFVHPAGALPPFADFRDSPVPYAYLLPLQLAIVLLMAGTTIAVADGRIAPRRTRGRQLLACGALYCAATLSRLFVGFAVIGAPPWFHAWLPATFHFVLAGFVLTLAAFHLRRV
ncbi:MAG TPA: hypothetical protein PJ986_19615 [Gammaproteobacteria bacterium]|nr:hypothetical protein [Gammaproteobacteria bacterium]